MANGLFYLTTTLPSTLAYLLTALIPLYLEFYCVGSRAPASITFLTTALAVIVFAIGPYIAPTQCPQLDIILRLQCGTAVMKALDMYFRRHNPPILKFSASPAKYAFYLLVELRYESFDISTARSRLLYLSNPWDYTVHLSIFLILQLLPQNSVVKAFGVLLAIWLIWNFMHFILKYPHSGPLFGPIYRASNLTVFWTETWHNVYTSPTRTGTRKSRRFRPSISACCWGCRRIWDYGCFPHVGFCSVCETGRAFSNWDVFHGERCGNNCRLLDLGKEKYPVEGGGELDVRDLLGAVYSCEMRYPRRTHSHRF